MMIPSSVHTRGTNMFHPLQDNPENNEQEEDEKAERGRGDGDKTELANVSWPPSDDEQSIDPILHTLTTSMDAPASAPSPTFSAPPLALHKQKYSALMASASISPHLLCQSCPVIASLMPFMLQQGLLQQIWRCHPSTSIMPFDLHRK
jgi:hypothetical protein